MNLIIIISVFIILPIIWKAVRSKNRKVKARKSEQVAYLTTYKNENISNEDIMMLFTTQCNLYLNQLNHFVHYLYVHNVYQEMDKQNYAWHIKTTKDEYNWATIITIEFSFSNGWFWVQVGNHEFNCGEKSSTTTTYYGKDYRKEIDIALLACRTESQLMWKKNNINPVLHGQNAGAPFSFYSLHPDDKFENDYQREANNNKSTKKDNKNIPDTISQLLKYFDVKYPNTDLNLLKRNYRSKLTEYHPDKVQHLGDDIKKLSEQKTKEIIENYNKLVKWLENDKK